MRRFHAVTVVVALLLMILVSACGSEPAPEVEDARQGAIAEAATESEATVAEAVTEDEAAAAEAATESEASSAEAAAESESAVAELRELDPNNFDDSSTNIDNEWFPLQPGTQWVYEGITVEEGVEIPHRVVFVVTDLTKVIEGVRTIVVWDQDYAAGELVEVEIAFFAQDKEGTVWHLGQYPEEYEKGKFVDAPAWIAGLAGAKAGISMKAEPQPGTPYFQGWGPAVDWTDYAQVDQMGQETCVPVDCYQDVLVIAETSLEEQGAFQLKYYARGVGNVRVGWRGDDTTQEELELVEFVQLDPEALAEARAAALELEKHAYEISPDVYGQTPPAEGP
jgi:hypothetical protein